MASRIRAVLGIMHGRRAFGGPIQANLRLTNRCNIRCIHCYYNSPYVEKPAFAPLRRAKQIGEDLPSSMEMNSLRHANADSKQMRSVIYELLRLGTRSWQLGGNGEPFMHQEFLEFAGILKRSGSHCITNSNGTLIDAEIADQLIRMQFDELRVTTMAGTPESYVRTHPGSTKEKFSILKRNLEYIVEQRNALNARRPKITLVTVVIAENSDSLVEFAQFAAHIGADRVLFRPVDDIDDPGLAKVVPSELQAVSVQEQLAEVRLFLESRSIGHNIDYFRTIFRGQLNTEALYKHIPCYYGWLASFIDPDGEVYPCCRCYEPLGNAFERGFAEIWQGTSYQKFRHEALHISSSGRPVSGCDCYSCVHHTANLKVYQALHPLKGSSQHLKFLAPGILAGESGLAKGGTGPRPAG
jgi:radical SAM protein with 4Fe4S-binding SPASM domain